MKKKHFLTFIISLALLIALGLTYKSMSSLIPRDVKVGVFPLPPFAMKDKVSGDFTGFDIDLLKEIAKTQNLNLTFHEIEFEDVFKDIPAGNYDLSNSITILPDREKILAFAWPSIETSLSLVFNAGKINITSIDQLKDQVITVYIGTVTDLAMEWKKSGLIKDFTISKANLDEIYQDISEGKIEIFLNDHAVNKYYVDKFNGKINCLEDLNSYEYFGFPIKKGNDDLRSRLNKGLKKMFLSRKYVEIHKKYF